MKLKPLLLAALLAFGLVGCGDPNSEPKFGADYGLPANCRAFVQYAIDSYREKKYTADQTFNSLERNCGIAGSLWTHRP